MKNKTIMILAAASGAVISDVLRGSPAAQGGPILLVHDDLGAYQARRLAEDQDRSERVARASAKVREEAEIAAGRAAMEAAEAKRARKNANRLRTRR